MITWLFISCTHKVFTKTEQALDYVRKAKF